MGRGYGSDGTCRVCIVAAARARRERMAGLAAEGHTSREIGEIVGTSPGAVRFQLSQLRHQPPPVRGSVHPATIGDE